MLKRTYEFSSNSYSEMAGFNNQSMSRKMVKVTILSRREIDELLPCEK